MVGMRINIKKIKVMYDGTTNSMTPIKVGT